jgi:tight adherence protein C
MSLPDVFAGSAPAALPIALAVGVANFLTILAVMRALSHKDLVGARARNHAKRRRELRTALLTPKRASGRAKPIGLARQLLERLKLTRGAEARKAASLLVQAGWRSSDATTVFLALRLASPLVLGLVAYLLAPSLMAGVEATTRAFIAMAGVGLGAYAPTLMLKNAINKRRQKIQKGLPDALDLFVICAEAGLSLDAAVTRVAREIGPSAAELSDELGLTAIELGFLPDRREALLNLGHRVDTPQVRGLVNTLVQTEKYGTPLAQSLRVLAGEFRDTRMMKAEEKAARLPATLTVPMITFILPPLFVVLIGPAIVQVMKASFS